MGFFSNFKINFGFGDNNHDKPQKERHSHHHHHHHDNKHNEREMVENGLGVFAWIKKDGMFYEGDIPGVSGIMNVNMADSFEECFNELKENINDSISTSFSSFKQKVSYEEIKEEHPDARIVFIPIKKD